MAHSFAVGAAYAGLILTVACSCGSSQQDNEPPAPQPVDVTFVVTVPNDTPEADTVSVMGSFTDWQSTALTRRADGRHVGTFTLMTMEAASFRFTRGAWERVEMTSDGFSVDDRQLMVAPTDDDTEVELTVSAWADRLWPRASRSGRIEIWRPTAWPDRRVWTYLPPGYATSTARYPVLYMLDGQNVFDAGTSFVGEWNVDETIERLIRDQEIKPIIVVAVDNAGAQRIDEYTPVAVQQTGGDGGPHLDRIVADVKSEVDQRFRTLTGRDDTAMSGSSLGGLMSLYAAYARPEVFGAVAALSPSIWWGDRWIVDYIEAQAKYDGRIYMDMGTLEQGSAIADLRAMAQVLRAQGFVDEQDLVVVEAAGAGHNEAAWRGRVPDILRLLYPPQ